MGEGNPSGVMNIKVTQRLVLGLLASLLLAAGFARAADRIDPVSLSLRVIQKDDDGTDGSAGGCVAPCGGDGTDGDR